MKANLSSAPSFQILTKNSVCEIVMANRFSLRIHENCFIWSNLLALNQFVQFTQKGLAEKLNEVHFQLVSNWERGICAPSSHAFEDVTRIFKLDRKLLVDSMR